ncbi:unnamed protein product [Lupinus luteus]|uniref:Uncharacterized protein n=1 Tax=Lupinus luteus TaxID=3873 RepID=A0AAV1WSR7_LUPLU
MAGWLIDNYFLHCFLDKMCYEPQKFSKDRYEEHLQVKSKMFFLPSIRGSASRIVTVNFIVSHLQREHLNAIESGKVENVPAPAIAIDY